MELGLVGKQLTNQERAAATKENMQLQRKIEEMQAEMEELRELHKEAAIKVAAACLLSVQLEPRICLHSPTREVAVAVACVWRGS